MSGREMDGSGFAHGRIAASPLACAGAPEKSGDGHLPAVGGASLQTELAIDGVYRALIGDCAARDQVETAGAWQRSLCATRPVKP